MVKRGGRNWWHTLFGGQKEAEIGGTPFLVVKRGGRNWWHTLFGGQKGWQKRVADLAAPLFGGQKGWQKLAADHSKGGAAKSATPFCHPF